ncbi:MAG: hypothetical protein AAF388_21300 [Bacteroidota bacterium]
MSEAEIKNTLFQWIDELSGEKLKSIFQLVGKEIQTREDETSLMEEDLALYARDLTSIEHLLIPEKHNLNINQLLESKDFKGVRREKMDEYVQRMNLTEPLDELLKTLK